MVPSTKRGNRHYHAEKYIKYEIKPQDPLTDGFIINVEDFKGNIMIIGLTHFFEYKGNPTFFQTSPIRVTIK